MVTRSSWRCETLGSPMLAAIDKREILKLLRECVSADLATMSAAQRVVVDGATHEENRPEND